MSLLPIPVAKRLQVHTAHSICLIWEDTHHDLIASSNTLGVLPRLNHPFLHDLCIGGCGKPDDVLCGDIGGGLRHDSWRIYGRDIRWTFESRMNAGV